MATRVEVYRAIESELAAMRTDDITPTYSVHAATRTVEGHVELLRECLDRNDYAGALRHMRHVTAVGVKCMELFGAPRPEDDPVPVLQIEPDQPRRRRAKSETAE